MKVCGPVEGNTEAKKLLELVSIVFVGLRRWYEPDEFVGAM